MVILPGESFVGYQLMAQRIRPDSFVMAIGYGECWTGYVPTQHAFEERFNHDWRWVGPGCEPIIREKLASVLRPRLDLSRLVLRLDHVRDTGLAVNLAIRKRLLECGDASVGDVRIHEPKVIQLGQSMEVSVWRPSSVIFVMKIEFLHVTQPTDVQ